MGRPIFETTMPAVVTALQAAGAELTRDPNGGYRLTNDDGTHSALQIDEDVALLFRAMIDGDIYLREALAPTLITLSASVGHIMIIGKGVGGSEASVGTVTIT